jgi:hypothetical protein
MAADQPSMARRLADAWRAMHGEQRLAATAAIGLVVSLFLPWYSTSATVTRVVNGKLQSATGHDTHSAIYVFSFVEAAVLLVAAGVLALLFARAERRAFHLPGGDGGVIAAAGGWAAFLILWRFFDRPGLGRGVTVGLAWGIFVALAVAAFLAYAGARVRAAQRPEPPLERAAPEAPTVAAPGTTATRPLLELPGELERQQDGGHEDHHDTHRDHQPGAKEVPHDPHDEPQHHQADERRRGRPRAVGNDGG